MTGVTGGTWRGRVVALTAAAVVAAGGAGAQPALADDTADLAAAKQRAAQAQAALNDSTAAVRAAGAQLAQVNAQLPGAQQAAAAAQGQLAAAQAALAAARAEAARAEAARKAAAAEVSAADKVVAQGRDQVARLARMAYQRGGLGDLRDVISATQPRDALERGQMLKSIFDAGTASLDRMTSARLDLAAKRAQLVAEDKAAAAARERAVAEQARATQLTKDSEAAVARVQGLIQQRQQAMAAAEANRAADQRLYDQAQADSAALAERIRRAQAAAAAARAAEAARAAAAAARAGRSAPPPPPQLAVPSGTGWLWPVPGFITTYFGWRTHPIFGYQQFHPGIDIAANSGTPIRASQGGVVLSAGWAGGYGQLVVIDHGNGMATAYAHQSQILVSAGQTVGRGQVIGLVGSTGNSTGPHLHFEIRENGNPVDPLGFVRQ